MPLTEWWGSTRIRKEMQIYFEEKSGLRELDRIVDCVQKMVTHWSDPTKPDKVKAELLAFDRYAALTGLILWAGADRQKPERRDSRTDAQVLAAAVKNERKNIAAGLHKLLLDILGTYKSEGSKPEQDLVYQVSLNRKATLAIKRSVPAVKADAAHRLFTIDCSEITWAVVDSGVRGDHPAFKGADGKSRVCKCFDFSNYRKIVSLNNLKLFNTNADRQAKKKRDDTLALLLRDELKNRPTEKDAIHYLTSLAEDARTKRPVHWEFVEPFVEIDPATVPTVSDHGTHVAGIIGASKEGAKYVQPDERDDYVDGLCPDIRLYDFRVLSSSDSIKDTEFAIIAALQYIRHVNERHDFITIHGANLSLSIPHDVRNYACGRTPVCDECEHLVNSGVVVAAAAGNFGYQNFQTKDGSYEGYAAFSITDPGNADGVITVGATHRYWPHTYGVSFFSSRGPTGDGRIKPDLVAPGERIRAPFRDSWADLDGTSMAAPHVSGAAAMLMARYSELIGQPRRIKRILCDSATDLGRERSFQGHGMLDVLRAFQSL
jgi:serine protease AprX